MDEKKLIERCIAGENRAWRRFLGRYQRCIHGAILSLLAKFSIHEAEIADDIFASVIEKLLLDDCRALRCFRWNSKFSTWLISIARNRTYDYLRGLKRRPTISFNVGGEDEDNGLEKVLAADLDLEHEMETHLTAEEALDLLPTGERLVLKLYYLEGMKEKEIAELLGLSLDAVSARKSRSLKKIRTLVLKDRV
jgi:RNA polymerase sigma-70 factor (ECF subfamily)